MFHSHEKAVRCKNLLFFVCTVKILVLTACVRTMPCYVREKKPSLNFRLFSRLRIFIIAFFLPL